MKFPIVRDDGAKVMSETMQPLSHVSSLVLLYFAPPLHSAVTQTLSGHLICVCALFNLFHYAVSNSLSALFKTRVHLV